jgi:hypothetical protein
VTRNPAVGQVRTEQSVAPLRRRAGAPARGASPPVPGPRPRVTLLLVAAMVAGVAGAWATSSPAGAPPTTPLEVFAHGEGEVAFAREVEVGETFRLEHTHSVTRRGVVETFSVQDATTVAIEELWFDEPGPNLPAGAEPLGDGMTTFTREDGAFRVQHHGHPIGTLPLMVGGPDVDHVVVFADGQRVRLLDIVRRGERVELTLGRQRG